MRDVRGARLTSFMSLITPSVRRSRTAFGVVVALTLPLNGGVDTDADARLIALVERERGVTAAR